MLKIPVTFTWNQKTYTGLLEEVSGGGCTMFHLSIRNYYQGCLIKTQQGNWQFSTQKQGIIKELSEYFGREVDTYTLR